MFGCFFGHKWGSREQTEYRDERRFGRDVIETACCERCGTITKALVETNDPDKAYALHKWVNISVTELRAKKP